MGFNDMLLFALHYLPWVLKHQLSPHISIYSKPSDGKLWINVIYTFLSPETHA